MWRSAAGARSHRSQVLPNQLSHPGLPPPQARAARSSWELACRRPSRPAGLGRRAGLAAGAAGRYDAAGARRSPPAVGPVGGDQAVPGGDCGLTSSLSVVAGAAVGPVASLRPRPSAGAAGRNEHPQVDCLHPRKCLTDASRTPFARPGPGGAGPAIASWFRSVSAHFRGDCDEGSAAAQRFTCSGCSTATGWGVACPRSGCSPRPSLAGCGPASPNSSCAPAPATDSLGPTSGSSRRKASPACSLDSPGASPARDHKSPGGCGSVARSSDVGHLQTAQGSWRRQCRCPADPPRRGVSNAGEDSDY